MCAQRTRRNSPCLLLCLAILFAASPSAGQQVVSWPQFRGVNGGGVATVESLPAEFGPDKNGVWAVEVPHGVSSPCIWADRIFLTAYEKDQSRLKTICLDRSTGQILWQAVAPAEKIEEVHEVSSPANATPVADGERVYVYFGSYGLLCYDHSGELVWEHALPMPEGRFGTGTSPILVEDKLILNHDLMMRTGAGDSYLLALDRRTGREVWRAVHPPTFTPYPTPVHWQRVGQMDQILTLSFGQLTAHDAENGRELWSLKELPPQVIATPTIGGDYLYLTATGMFGDTENAVPQRSFAEMVKEFDSDNDGLISMDEIPQDLLLVDRKMSGSAGDSPVRQFASFGDRNKDQKIDREEWDAFIQQARQFISQSAQGVFAISLPEGDGGGRIIWSEPQGVPEIPSPLYIADRLYLVMSGGRFYCRDAKTGRQIYRGRLRAVGGYYSSPVYGDGKIFVASDRGVVSVLAAGDEFEILSTNDLGAPISATPAIVDEKIYIRTDTHLYAFAQRKDRNVD